MVEAIVFAPASLSFSTMFAWTSRGHGQRPMFWMLWSSIAMTAMSSLRVASSRDDILTPRS